VISTETVGKEDETMAGGGRGKKPSRSASAIVAGAERGQHLLKIAGYSRTKDVPTGSHIKSRSFRVGGHSWHVRYYPNGASSDWSDYISLMLQLDYHNVLQGVKAQFGFSLLDHGGKAVRTLPTSEVKTSTFTTDRGWGYLIIERNELEKSGHLKDDCFTIRCDLTVMTEIHTKDVDVATPRPPAAAVVVPPPELHRHLGGLLATGEAADVTFEVDGKTFPAHRLVLAARSPVFRAALSRLHLAAEHGAAPAAVVRIEDMEAQDFEAFLHYVYTDTMPEMNGNEAAAMLPDLVAAANRYKMERLRLLCEDELCEFVDARTVATMLTFAGEHHCHGLKEACLRFLEDPVNLKEVVKINGLGYLMSETCPSVLKDLIAKLVASTV
jgi:speckle-type POZ protein